MGSLRWTERWIWPHALDDKGLEHSECVLFSATDVLSAPPTHELGNRGSRPSIRIPPNPKNEGANPSRILRILWRSHRAWWIYLDIRVKCLTPQKRRSVRIDLCIVVPDKKFRSEYYSTSWPHRGVLSRKRGLVGHKNGGRTRTQVRMRTTDTVQSLPFPKIMAKLT